jgi:hypothetical protein
MFDSIVLDKLVLNKDNEWDGKFTTIAVSIKAIVYLEESKQDVTKVSLTNGEVIMVNENYRDLLGISGVTWTETEHIE